MQSCKEFIEMDFDLPDHEKELYDAEEEIQRLKENVLEIKSNNKLNAETHVKVFEKIMLVLDYVGRLSMPVFAIEDELEEQYILRYIHFPALGKKLWLDHYSLLHHPYNLLKNRCFRLIDEIDGEYERLFETKPPNWNP